MEQFAPLSYWVRFGAVVFVLVLGMITALRRSRAKASKRDVVFAVVGVVALGISIALGMRPDWLLAGGLLAAGIALGFVAARVRPLIAWLMVPIVAFASVMLLFGGFKAMAFGFSVLAFGVGMSVGQALRRPPKAAPLPSVQPAPTAEA